MVWELECIASLLFNFHIAYVSEIGRMENGMMAARKKFIFHLYSYMIRSYLLSLSLSLTLLSACRYSTRRAKEICVANSVGWIDCCSFSFGGWYYISYVDGFFSSVSHSAGIFCVWNVENFHIFFGSTSHFFPCICSKSFLFDRFFSVRSIPNEFSSIRNILSSQSQWFLADS